MKYELRIFKLQIKALSFLSGWPDLLSMATDGLPVNAS